MAGLGANCMPIVDYALQEEGILLRKSLQHLSFSLSILSSSIVFESTAVGL